MKRLDPGSPPGAASKPNLTGTVQPTDNLPQALRLELRAIIRSARRLGPVPQAFSDAWLRLPNDDPRRVAGLYLAALCWWSTGQTLVDDLREELALYRDFDEARREDLLDEALARCRRIASSSTHADLQRLRYGGDAA